MRTEDSLARLEAMDVNPVSNPAEPRPITALRVSEVSVETTGVMPKPPRVRKRLWSLVSLWLGIVSLGLAPVFGIGVLPAILSVVVGHAAKRREPEGFVQWGVGLALSYGALVVGTAVLVFVALPLTVAFLVSTGYILSE